MPSYETDRLDALYALRLLDTEPEERFDQITRAAQTFFQVPIVLFSLVDADRVWVKSAQGLAVTQGERRTSLCTPTVEANGLIVIEDLSAEPRVADFPIVSGPPHARFYAGCPLQSPDGYRVGVMCLIDTKPRSFNAEQRRQLSDFGYMLEAQMRLRAEELGLDATATGGSLFDRHFHNLAARLGQHSAAALMAALALSFTLGLGIYTDRQKLDETRLIAKQEFRQGLIAARDRLSSSLMRSLFPLKSLHGLLKNRALQSPALVSSYAMQLVEEEPTLRVLQLAPQGVVSQSWPTNTGLGSRLLDDPELLSGAALAADTGKVWVSLPRPDGADGEYLIALQATPRLRGSKTTGVDLTVLEIDYDALLHSAGIERDTTGFFRSAMRHLNSDGSVRGVTRGEAPLFDSDAISTTIALPHGAWEIALLPASGWPDTWPGRRLHFTFFTMIGSAAGLLVYFLLRLPQRLRNTVTNTRRAMDRNQSRFLDAIDALPDGFSIYDAERRLVMFNSHLRNFYPSLGPLLRPGIHYDQIIDEVARANQISDPELLDAMRQIQPNRETQLADGRWLRVVKRTMRDGGTVHVQTDITDLKRKEQELAAAKHKAESANRAKTAFLANISHEVRTPMNGVLGLLELLMEDRNLNEQQCTYLRTAQDSGRNLLTILNDLLDVSRMEAGKFTLENQPFDLHLLLHACGDLMSAELAKKQLILTLDIDPALGRGWVGDQGRLRQVLINLLHNAAKFTERGGITIRARDQGGVQLAIIDTGIGIEADQGHAMFEPFNQLDNQNDRRYGGAGLGLSICKNLVDMMGGTIDAQPAAAGGTQINVHLPLPPCDLSAVPAAPPPLIANTAPQPAADTDLPPLRVLLAEDVATNRMIVEAMLANSRYRLDIAEDGLQAVAAAKSTAYDIILMDVSMPHLDGIAATRAIRKLNGVGPGRARLPIIALTANAMDSDRQEFMDAGMDDFLAKPITKPQLLLTLQRWAKICGEASAG